MALAVSERSAHLTTVLTHRRARLAGAEDVQVHRPDVPPRALRGCRPVLGCQSGEELDRAVELDGLECHRLVVSEACGACRSHVNSSWSDVVGPCASSTPRRAPPRHGDEVPPPGPAGVVGQLLRGHTRQDRGPQVHRRGVDDAPADERLGAAAVHVHGDLPTLRRRLETGDGAQEQQLEPGRVRGGEVHEGERRRGAQFDQVVGVGRAGRHVRPEGLVALSVHGVVDVVLRAEVGVQRRRRHPDGGGEIPERDAGEAEAACHLPRGLDDLGAGRLVPRSSAVDPRLRFPNTVRTS